jgi:hypothetical protein
MFPPGDYYIPDTMAWSRLDCYGFYGDGDVRFLPPSGYNSLLLNARGDEVLFEGIDVDTREANTTAGLMIQADTRLVVEDVEYLGRGTHPDDSVVNGLKCEVTDPNGTGLVKNFRMERGSAPGLYKGGNGRVGLFSSPEHEGTLRIENCHFEEFGNNALYASKNPGAIQVVDSYFRNNNIASIRISGEGSYVENTTVEIDMDEYTGPTDGLDNKLFMRAIWFQQGGYDFPGGAYVDGSEIAIEASAPDAAGIVVEDDAKTLDVSNTTIRVEADGERGIRRKVPNHSNGELTLDNVSVVGGAADAEAVLVSGTDGSTVRNSCIYSPEAGRDGIRFREASNATVRDTNISVGDDPIVEDGASVSVSGLTSTNDCPFPGGSDANSTPEHTITVESVGAEQTSQYRFETSGSLVKGDSATSEDLVDGTTASGSVGGGGVDSYRFDGEVVSFEVTDGDPNDIRVSIDGTEYLWNRLRVKGTGDSLRYEARVEGTIEKGQDADDGDTVSGNTAAGTVASPGVDDYRFTGDLTEFVVTRGATSDVTVYVNGKEYDQKSGYEHTAEVRSVGGEEFVEYELTTSGSLERGPNANSSDEVSGSTVAGSVAGGGRDDYRFDGSVEEFTVTTGDMDDVALYVDGDQVAIGDGRTVEVRSTGGEEFVEYELVTDGAIRKGSRANSSDEVSGSTAVGSVAGGGWDTYVVTGDVTAVRVLRGDPDDLSVVVDGSELEITRQVVVRSVGGEEFVEYELVANGVIQKGSRANSSDEVSGSTVVGSVAGGGRDSFLVAGDLSDFSVLAGPADDVAVTVNGTRQY